MISFGSSLRKPSKSSGSNFFVPMNCQLIGPSRSLSSCRPWVMNFSIESFASVSFLRLVQKREAFTANTKPSGVSSRHLAQVSGLKPE